jgi:type IV pilus assembly protein PilX
MMQRQALMIQRAQRGVTMLVVLVLLSVMLLGGMALARLTEIGTLASGNAAYHEAALQASEVGINTAFQAVRDLPDENDAIASWYSPTTRAKDLTGLPTGIDWDAAPTIAVGQMQVKYIAERACTVANVTNVLRQCLVKQEPKMDSRVYGVEKLDPPNSRQFRITVRVDGPKSTRTWVQSLVTRG